MFRGIYTAYTGMRTQQQKMDSISNNLANADTVGYKKDQMVQESFAEVMTHKINDPEMPHSESIGGMTLGVKVSEVYTDFVQGSLKQTDDPLNVALQGEGFMKVGKVQSDGSIETRYSRDGSFNLDQLGRLVTNDGLFVLGEDDNPITLSSNQMRINKDGSIYENEENRGQIQMVNFENLNTLRKEGNNLFITTEASEEKAFEGTLSQGFLESSNTSSIEEMINMITTTRTYETNQKVIQTYDATMDKVVNSVGTVR